MTMLETIQMILQHEVFPIPTKYFPIQRSISESDEVFLNPTKYFPSICYFIVVAECIDWYYPSAAASVIK